MTAAIFGLLGVIVGAVVNGGAVWLAERRKAKGEAKVAARVVLAEMESNRVAISTSIKEQTWGALTSLLSASKWNEHQTTFASALSDRDWEVVSSYYLAIAAMADVAKVSDPAGSLPEGFPKTLLSLFSRTEASQTALREYLGVEAPAAAAA